MKQYEYLIEYRYENKDSHGYTESMVAATYDYAMNMVKFFHNDGAKEVVILRREVSDWKPIHQSGLPDEVSAV
jgi:hypothetical protein